MLTDDALNGSKMNIPNQPIDDPHGFHEYVAKDFSDQASHALQWARCVAATAPMFRSGAVLFLC
jgi:hypothetical protein